MPQDITQQTLVENDLLHHLLVGLRSTLRWQVHGADFSRKLSTLRFIAQCFQRHMERMMTLEEDDGYMALVAATSPQLGRRVDALRSEHVYFRDVCRRIVERLEQVGPTDQPTFTAICDDLASLVQRVEMHSKKEIGLLQEAMGRDSGGEG